MKNISFKSKKADKNVNLDVFEDINDLVNYLKTAPTNRIFSGRTLHSQKASDGDSSFHDFNTYDEALSSLEYGFDKYFIEFENCLKKTKDYISKMKANKTGNFKNDVIGFVPIVPNAINGIPVNMINQNTKKKPIPTLRIFIERTVSCGVSVQDNTNFYSVVFALISLLEQKNIRCEIWECESSKDCDEIYINKTKIKDCLQPINTYKLQFPIISSDMLRRIGFRLLETCRSLKTGGWHFGYGSPLREMTYYDLTDDGFPNEGMQEILGISEEDIYIPSVQTLDCCGENLEYILKAILDKTGFKKYVQLI